VRGLQHAIHERENHEYNSNDDRGRDDEDYERHGFGLSLVQTC
jgi:hypothetical protein